MKFTIIFFILISIYSDHYKDNSLTLSVGQYDSIEESMVKIRSIASLFEKEEPKKVTLIDVQSETAVKQLVYTLHSKGYMNYFYEYNKNTRQAVLRRG